MLGFSRVVPQGYCLATSVAFIVTILSLKCLTNLLIGGLDHLSECPKGFFRIENMTDCHPYLKCSDFHRDLIVTDQILGTGATKKVVKGYWNGMEVVVSILRQPDHLEDFQHGLNMLLLFDSSLETQNKKVVQVIGWCFENTPQILTELHSMGDASKIHLVLESHFQEQNNLIGRFKVCIEYVKIINMLHTHPEGPRVMCDANYPEKALSQFLLTGSDNLTLVLNDMDALPQVNKEKGQFVKCGHRELQGDFVAPEQTWMSDEEFDDLMMPSYDEKVDIWKIPDVCNYIIGDIQGANKLQLYLFNIHSQCKQIEPNKRPSSQRILSVYKDIYDKMR